MEGAPRWLGWGIDRAPLRRLLPLFLGFLLLGPCAHAQEGALEGNKSYSIPAAEIAAFDFLVNRYGRWVYGKEFSVTAATVRRNFRSTWRTDTDPYGINQLGHPYQGSMYHGFAR